MKKVLYSIFVSLFLISCSSNEDVTDDILEVTSIDLSSLTIYAGSDDGGVEVQYNNLKRTELVNRFFKNKYKYDLYNNVRIQFFDNRLTFTDTANVKIVSGYIFERDSLFLNRLDTATNKWSKKFVALGTTPDDLHCMKGLARYSYKLVREPVLRDTIRDTILAVNEVLTLDKMLAMRGFSSLTDMKDPTDTLVWCNAIYTFK